MRGYDKYSDDWDDEGVLSNGPGGHTNSNATCLWQKIMWAEGVKFKINNVSQQFTRNMIDGNFGLNTNRATRNLQATWDLSPDGEVGGGTFGRAADNLYKESGSTDRGERLVLGYKGKVHTFTLIRNAEGKYVFKDRYDDWRQAGYDYHSCG
ncbi:peptidoglycan-binding domain-containing protein [Streptomyces swartbergensis]|uniref:peptidoglycan-binding domain-containing protein n=1 Tax=Streptomyces swartbergensis TaxID=487165 RepID=UPI001FCA1688|nr:Tat pathway signal protein [Streptomyces swartbergensis]